MTQIDQNILLTWGATLKNFKKNDIIFLEGQEARCYYQVVSGQIRMFNINSDGKEFTQGIFNEGQSFGEPPLFINKPYPSSCIAAKDSTVLKLSSPIFFKILEEYPELCKVFLTLFALRIFNKSETIREVVNNHPEQRILGFLNAMKRNEDCADSGGKRLVPYTRQEIANFTGLRVETVIRTLIKMKETGTVDIIERKLYY